MNPTTAVSLAGWGALGLVVVCCLAAIVAARIVRRSRLDRDGAEPTVKASPNSSAPGLDSTGGDGADVSHVLWDDRGASYVTDEHLATSPQVQRQRDAARRLFGPPAAGTDAGTT